MSSTLNSVIPFKSSPPYWMSVSERFCIQWLLDGKNRASAVKRTPQCEWHLIPLGRSFAIGAIHVRGIQGAYLSCMTDSMHQPGHTRVKSSIGFN